MSFTSEHIETLAELDHEYRKLAENAGIVRWERVQTLGVSVPFIKALTEVVLEALPETTRPTVQPINEGEPVSLRIVNDLLEMYQKNVELVPQDKNWGFGLTDQAELLNGRAAMAGVGALLLSYVLRFEGLLPENEWASGLLAQLLSGR